MNRGALSGTASACSDGARQRLTGLAWHAALVFALVVCTTSQLSLELGPSWRVAKPPSCLAIVFVAVVERGEATFVPAVARASWSSIREHVPREKEAVAGEAAEPLARAELRTPGNRAPLVPCRCRADYGRLERHPPGVALPTRLPRA